MERLGLLMAEKEVQGLSSFVWVSHHANEATPKQTQQTRSVVHLARQWPAAITGGLIAGGCSRGVPDIETRAGGCAAAIGSFPSSLHASEESVAIDVAGWEERTLTHVYLQRLLHRGGRSEAVPVHVGSERL